MDEQIEMPFRILSQLDLRNHILDGCPDPPMGRGNFEGKGHPGMPDNTATSCAKMAEATEMPFGLWTRWDMEAHWCSLANTTKLSMCGSDAASSQITLTTCVTICNV